MTKNAKIKFRCAKARWLRASRTSLRRGRTGTPSFAQRGSYGSVGMYISSASRANFYRTTIGRLHDFFMGNVKTWCDVLNFAAWLLVAFTVMSHRSISSRSCKILVWFLRGCTDWTTPSEDSQRYKFVKLDAGMTEVTSLANLFYHSLALTSSFFRYM